MIPRRDLRKSQGTQRRFGSRRLRPDQEEGEGPESYAPPKKSNTALIVGIAGGAALVVVLLLVVALGSGSKQNPYRRRVAPPPTPMGSGPSTSTARPLTQEERSMLAEANSLLNQAKGTRDRYTEKSGGAYVIRADVNKEEALSAVEGAIGAMERRTSLMEELNRRTGENFEEEGGGKVLQTLRYMRRELAKALGRE